VIQVVVLALALVIQVVVLALALVFLNLEIRIKYLQHL
jgi:hypothetical protein